MGRLSGQQSCPIGAPGQPPVVSIEYGVGWYWLVVACKIAFLPENILAPRSYRKKRILAGDTPAPL